MTDDDKKTEADALTTATTAPAAPPTAPDPDAATSAEPVTPEGMLPPGPVPDLKSEPAFADTDALSAAPAVAPVDHQPRRGGFVAPLLGGALAAAAGFALSHYNVFELRADSSQVELRIAALETGLSDVRAEAGEGAAAAGQKADEALSLAQQLSETTGQGGETEFAALEARIAETEAALQALAQAAPDGSVPAAAFASLQAEVEALKTQATTGQAASDPEAIRTLIGEELDARAGEITAKAEEEAAALREAARREAALNALVEGVNNGQPYAAALAALELEAPSAALSDHAETGITSLAGLTASFPEAARLALEASLRSDGGDTLSDRAWAMLRIGTGARSLSPQPGTDPDAVLSRAEAAVKAGDLATALSELEALPDPGKAAMADWMSDARSRLDAVAALAALSAQQPE